MDDRIKKLELREDGFMEIILKRIKDFDDYIFQQILKEGSCLPCVRDHRSKTKFYFDTKGYISLRDYLQVHVFEDSELYNFLLYIFEDLVKVNSTIPVSMNLDHIFISYDGVHIRFIVFPLTSDNWMFQKEVCSTFFINLLKEIRVQEAYAAIGYIVMALKKEEISIPTMLQGLLNLKEKQKKVPTLFEKLFHMHIEEPYYVKEVPQPITYPKNECIPLLSEEEQVYKPEKRKNKEELHNTTMVLFAEESDVYLIDEKDNKKIQIISEQFFIGRADDNTLILKEAYISAHHALICKSKHTIEDLKSSNGTFVNKERMKATILKDGDSLSFGTKVYTFRCM
ncbi:MAG: FHA domain-containing protein [Longicatena sp.]